MLRYLIRLSFPRHFRRRFGRDLADAVADRVAVARQRGRAAAAVAWVRAALDLTAHGIAERRAGRRHAAPPRRHHMLQAIVQDVRFAIRTFRARPGFTAVALLTLALGIGANTAIFSVVHAVILRDLPYPSADRIAIVYGTHRQYDFDRGVMNPFDVTYIEDRAASIESLAVMRSGSVTLTGAGEPVRLGALNAAPAFFDVLGVRPDLGRAFTAGEARDEAPVAVISHDLWSSRFGERADIVGQRLALDDEAWTVIGVMPARFNYPEGVDIWRPFALTPEDRETMGAWYLGVAARLRPGVEVADAQTELTRLGAELEAAYPQARTDRGFNVVGLKQALAARSAEGLTLLQGVVVFVLLIACVNVANLLLAQSGARRRELGVRAAVGGTRGRLVRQLLTESVILATAGGALGVIVALWGVGALVAMAPAALLPDPESIGVSWPVLGATALAAAGTGVLFGLAPAILASAPDLGAALGAGQRTAGGGLGWSRRQWLRAGLVASEVAVALVLLTGAGLLVRSFSHLLGQAPGFQAERLLTATISLPAARYPDAESRYPFWTSLIDRLEALPGATGAAGSTALPFSLWEWQTGFLIHGREDVPNEGAGVRTVTPGFFDTLGIQVLAGRAFTAADGAASEKVVIVSDAFARQHMAGLDPVGQQIATSVREPEFATVVGVVGATRHLGLHEAPRPEIYRPLAQDPNRSTYLIAVRTRGDAMAMADGLRQTVAALDPALPVQDVKPMAALIEGRVAERRFYMTLLTLFAGLAVTLAATGIYGVMAYVVSQGRREFGIRIALGAQARRLRLDLVRRGLAVVAVGAGAGLVGAWWLSSLVEAQLFEVPATDPATYAAAMGLLLVVAALACWIPTGRAAKVNAVEALRE